MNNIAQKLISLAEHYSGVTAVTLNFNLREDLGLDSLSLTELIVACEDEFGIEIDMDNPMTVNATTLKDLHDGIVFLKESNPS